MSLNQNSLGFPTPEGGNVGYGGDEKARLIREIAGHKERFKVLKVDYEYETRPPDDEELLVSRGIGVGGGFLLVHGQKVIRTFGKTAARSGGNAVATEGVKKLMAGRGGRA